MDFSQKLKDKLNESGIILIHPKLDLDAVGDIVMHLMTLGTMEPKKEIQLFIVGNGGFLGTMPLYDALSAIPNPVSATAIGNIGNFRLLLLARANHRYALKHTEFTLEEPGGSLDAGANQQTEVLIEAKEATTERNILETLLAKHTSKSFEKIHADVSEGITLNAEEALKYGFIDEIIE